MRGISDFHYNVGRSRDNASEKLLDSTIPANSQIPGSAPLTSVPVDPANNSQDLCERLGLNKQHRHITNHHNGITHSSSPVGRRSQYKVEDAEPSAAPTVARPRSSSRHGTANALKREEREQRSRGSSLGRAPTPSSTPSSRAMRPLSGRRVGSKQEPHVARSAGSQYAHHGSEEISQKFRPIGKHHRLRTHISQSRQFNAGLVLSSENGAVAVREQTAYRELSHSPIVHGTKNAMDNSEPTAVTIREATHVAGRTVPYRPRSANNTSRGISRKIL